MSDLSLPGLLRRIRRTADLSQRELAQAGGVARSTIAAGEAGTRGLDARALARLATVAGLRLALLDQQGREVAPMDAEAVRDGGGRLFPAHLDTRHGDEGWWHGPHRFDRPPVTCTFTRDRGHATGGGHGRAPRRTTSGRSRATRSPPGPRPAGRPHGGPSRRSSRAGGRPAWCRRPTWASCATARLPARSSRTGGARRGTRRAVRVHST